MTSTSSGTPYLPHKPAEMQTPKLVVTPARTTSSTGDTPTQTPATPARTTSPVGEGAATPVHPPATTPARTPNPTPSGSAPHTGPAAKSVYSSSSPGPVTPRQRSAWPRAHQRRATDGVGVTQTVVGGQVLPTHALTMRTHTSRRHHALRRPPSHSLTTLPVMKATFAGRSARRRMRYGYHCVPNGT